MRQIIAIGLFAFLGVHIIAAPVPKPLPVKTNAEKIVGKWDLVKSSNGLAEGTKCIVELTKDGKMSITMDFGERTIKYEGTYKFDKDNIDYEVSLNGNKKAEILTIKMATDDELAVTDPDGIVEEFKRSVEKKEVKEEPNLERPKK